MDDNTTASVVAASSNDPANTVQEMWIKFMEIPIEYNAAEVVHQLSASRIDLIQLESHMTKEEMGNDGLEQMYQAWDCLFCIARDANPVLFEAWRGFKADYVRNWLVPNELGDRADLLILLDLQYYVAHWECAWTARELYTDRLLVLLNEKSVNTTGEHMQTLVHDGDDPIANSLLHHIVSCWNRTLDPFGKIDRYNTFARNADRFWDALTELDACNLDLCISGRGSGLGL